MELEDEADLLVAEVGKPARVEFRDIDPIDGDQPRGRLVQGAQDVHHLEALILDFDHPIDRDHLAQRLGLHADWNFDELFSLILIGECSGEEIDRVIHQGIQ